MKTAFTLIIDLKYYGIEGLASLTPKMFSEMLDKIYNKANKAVEHAAPQTKYLQSKL